MDSAKVKASMQIILDAVAPASENLLPPTGNFGSLTSMVAYYLKSIPAEFLAATEEDANLMLLGLAFSLGFEASQRGWLDRDWTYREETKD